MYVEIPFWRFLLGLLIVAAPVALMEQAGEGRVARNYVILILLAMMIANWQGVLAFSRFVEDELG